MRKTKNGILFCIRENNIILFVCYIFLILFLCTLTSCDTQDDARQRGYNAGLTAGEKAAIRDVDEEIKKITSDYENKISENEILYKEQIKKAYEEAYASGMESMKNDIQEIISVEKKTKRQKKEKWNDLKR